MRMHVAFGVTGIESLGVSGYRAMGKWGLGL